MNKRTQEIYDKLKACNLTEVYRTFVMNPNSPKEYLVVYLMLSDRFETFEDLLNAIRACLKDLRVEIIIINTSQINIKPI